MKRPHCASRKTTRKDFAIHSTEFISLLFVFLVEIKHRCTGIPLSLLLFSITAEDPREFRRSGAHLIYRQQRVAPELIKPSPCGPLRLYRTAAGDNRPTVRSWIAGSAEIRVTLTTSKITCAISEEGMIPASCIFQRLYTRPSPLKQLDQVTLSTNHHVQTAPESTKGTLGDVIVHLIPSVPHGGR